MFPSWMRTPSMSVIQVDTGLRSFTFQLLPAGPRHGTKAYANTVGLDAALYGPCGTHQAHAQLHYFVGDIISCPGRAGA
jgi:hypothetical protein